MKRGKSSCGQQVANFLELVGVQIVGTRCIIATLTEAVERYGTNIIPIASLRILAGLHYQFKTRLRRVCVHDFDYVADFEGSRFSDSCSLGIQEELGFFVHVILLFIGSGNGLYRFPLTA